MNETEICDAVCSSDFSCNWSKWNNPMNFQFPDGSSQTCVGAQVRCGCTTTMSLIRLITYEHPTTVTVFVLIIVTLILFMAVKCMLTYNCCGFFHCLRPETNEERRRRLMSRNSDLNAEIARVVEAERNQMYQIYVVETEKPPSYAYVMTQEIDLPPSYVDCMKENHKICQRVPS